MHRDDGDNQILYDTASPAEAYRVTWTQFMMAFISTMASGLEDELPIMLRTGRVILAYSLERDPEYNELMEYIDEDQDLITHAKVMEEATGVDWRKIHRREVEWREMEELQKVAVRSALWGHFRQRPDPESRQLLTIHEGDE